VQLPFVQSHVALSLALEQGLAEGSEFARLRHRSLMCYPELLSTRKLRWLLKFQSWEPFRHHQGLAKILLDSLCILGLLDLVQGFCMLLASEISPQSAGKIHEPKRERVLFSLKLAALERPPVGDKENPSTPAKGALVWNSRPVDTAGQSQ
jgi:hypothetical protein